MLPLSLSLHILVRRGLWESLSNLKAPRQQQESVSWRKHLQSMTKQGMCFVVVVFCMMKNLLFKISIFSIIFLISYKNFRLRLQGYFLSSKERAHNAVFSFFFKKVFTDPPIILLDCQWSMHCISLTKIVLTWMYLLSDASIAFTTLTDGWFPITWRNIVMSELLLTVTQ